MRNSSGSGSSTPPHPQGGGEGNGSGGEEQAAVDEEANLLMESITSYIDNSALINEAMDNNGNGNGVTRGVGLAQAIKLEDEPPSGKAIITSSSPSVTKIGTSPTTRTVGLLSERPSMPDFKSASYITTPAIIIHQNNEGVLAASTKPPPHPHPPTIKADDNNPTGTGVAGRSTSSSPTRQHFHHNNPLEDDEELLSGPSLSLGVGGGQRGTSSNGGGGAGSSSLAAPLSSNNNNLRHVVSRQSMRSAATNAAPGLSGGGLGGGVDDSISSVPPGPGGVFKWSLFRNVSIFNSSQGGNNDTNSFGQFTCLLIWGNFICFGSTGGAVLLFDLTQKFLFSLVTKDVAPAVSCISLGKTDVLIVGHTDGQVRLWDMRKRSLIHRIDPLDTPSVESGDGHQRGVSIVWVALHSAEKFYTADANGHAFYHVLSNRILYTSRTSIRIHGRHDAVYLTRTTIQAFAPLRKSTYGGKAFEGDVFQIVAITSPYKLAILSMKPTPQIQYRASWSQIHRVSELEGGVPCSELKWWSPYKKELNVNIRRLAFSYGFQLAVLNVTCRSGEGDPSKRKLMFQVNARSQDLQPDATIEVSPDDITAIEWLNSSFLLVLTRSASFKIYDSQTLRLIEKGSILPREVLSPFGNSPIIQHHSVCCYYHRLFILTQQGDIFFAGLINWQDRLSILIKAGQFKEAFRIGIDLYKGLLPFAALQIPSGITDRQSVVSTHLVALILNFVTMTMSGYASSSDLAQLEDSGAYAIPTELVFETCLAIDQSSLIFGEIWDRYLDAGLDSVYLSVLKNFILQERINSVQNPIIIQLMFASSLANLTKERKNEIEQVLLHLDPFSLDIDRTISMCREHTLTNALIYIYNLGLSDFSTPILEIIYKISKDPSSVDSHQDLYNLFVYFSYVLNGKAFPIGKLDEEQTIFASQKIFGLLFSPKMIKTPPSLKINVEEDKLFHVGKEPWPYFDFLVCSDTPGMIGCLSSLFQNTLLDAGISFEDEFNQKGVEGHHEEVLLITRQYIINILLHLVKTGRPEWTRERIDTTYAFVARSYKKYQRYLSFSRDQLMEIFSALLDSDVKDNVSERQNALMTLYDTGFLPLRAEADKNIFLERFELAGFWKIYQQQMIAQGNYELGLLSFFRDPKRKYEAFEAVRSWLKVSSSLKEKEAIKLAVERHLSDLVFEGSSLSSLYDDFWPSDHMSVIDNLKSSPSSQLLYLECLVQAKNAIPQRPREPDRPREFYALYLRLLARLKPLNLLKYLESSSKTFVTLPFDLDSILTISKEYEIVDVQIWAMIERKNFAEALALTLDTLLAELSKEGLSKENHRKLESYFQQSIKICEVQLEVGKDIHWNMLMDKLCFELKITNPFISKLRLQAITAAMAHVSIPAILIRYIEHQSKSTIGEHRELFNYLLDASHHQQETVQYAERLSQDHLFQEYSKLCKILKSSFTPNLGQCQICKRVFHLRAMTAVEQRESLIVFRCHHAYHLECLSEALEKAHVKMKIPSSASDYEKWCLVCGAPSNRKHKGKSALQYVSMPDLNSGTGDSNRTFLAKLDAIETFVYRAKPNMFDIYKNLQKHASVKEKEDTISMNESYDDY